MDIIRHMHKNILLFKQYIYILLVFCIISLLGLQTMFSDEGYYLSMFQYYFDKNGLDTNDYISYLTTFVGGCWEAMFGWGGIISHRILTAFITTLTFYYVLRWLKEYKKYSLWIFIGFVASQLHGVITCISSPVLSCLFLSSAICYITEALKENNNKKYLLGYFLLGLSVFARLTNIIFAIVFIFAPIFLYKKRNGSLNKVEIGIIGNILAVCFVLAIIILLGHFSYFFDALFVDLVNSGTSSKSSHNLFSTLTLLFHDWIIVFAITSALSLFVWISNRIRNKVFYSFFCITCIVGFYKGYTYIISNISILGYGYVLYSIGITAILFNLKYLKGKYEYIIIALLVALLMPIGSDVGLLGITHASLCLLLCLCGAIINVKSTHANGLIKIFLLTYILIRFTFLFRFGNFQDYGTSRFEMHYTIQNSELATVLVSKEKAKSIDELLNELRKHVHPGENLMCFMASPIINYFTKTIPYAYHSCPIYIDAYKFISNLDKAKEYKRELPVIILDKNINLKDPGNKMKIDYFKNFIENNKYRIIWSNNSYKILTPNK